MRRNERKQRVRGKGETVPLFGTRGEGVGSVSNHPQGERGEGGEGSRYCSGFSFFSFLFFRWPNYEVARLAALWMLCRRSDPSPSGGGISRVVRGAAWRGAAGRLHLRDAAVIPLIAGWGEKSLNQSL